MALMALILTFGIGRIWRRIFYNIGWLIKKLAVDHCYTKYNVDYRLSEFRIYARIRILDSSTMILNRQGVREFGYYLNHKQTKPASCGDTFNKTSFKWWYASWTQYSLTAQQVSMWKTNYKHFIIINLQSRFADLRKKRFAPRTFYLTFLIDRGVMHFGSFNGY